MTTYIEYGVTLSPNQKSKLLSSIKNKSPITLRLKHSHLRGSDELMLTSLLAEVSHDEAKMRERRETSAGFRSVFYHACVCVSLTTSDVFVACDTTHRTGLHAKLQEMSRTPQSRKFEESEDVR